MNAASDPRWAPTVALGVIVAVLQLAGCSTGGTGTAPPRDAVLPAQAQALYAQRCAGCHEAGVDRAPDAATLHALSPARIHAALSRGVMREQAQGLSDEQLQTLARYLGDDTAAAAPGAPASARCAEALALPADALRRPHWNGWSADTAQHRAQSAGMARLAAADLPRLQLKWAYGFPDTIRMFAQPTVVAGKVFVGGEAGQVVALDAARGCIYWDFKADAGVRSAITLGRDAHGNWSAYFGDARGSAYAIDAATGALRWRTPVETHPAARVTGAPTLHEGRLCVPVASVEEVTGRNPQYACCTFRGSVSALDAATGRLLWKHYTIAQEPAPQPGGDGTAQHFGPSGAAVWSSPTIDARARRLYVATGNTSARATEGSAACRAMRCWRSRSMVVDAGCLRVRRLRRCFQEGQVEVGTVPPRWLSCIDKLGHPRTALSVRRVG